MRADQNLPRIISFGFIVVVSISSSVCLSRSPLILLAVNAGIINISIKNSMDETKVYSSKKREYCISAVTLTCSTTVNILNRATIASTLLNISNISAIRILRLLTVSSLL